ncbi:MULTISPECIES: hypothetical protein [unclassified Lysinibacillus]|uniref:hypothetical protein n=1 Tax=unclassified Lysinibacillus TaxID=2636778 RepID=UPI00201B38AF|nr:MULTISPECIES: hypothetical protein [unclassified Lysinibacillus]
MYRLPQMGTFFTPQRLDVFWSYVGALIKYIAPAIMIAVALYCVGMVLNVIISAFRKGADSEDRRKDDDDIDMKYY